MIGGAEGAAGGAAAGAAFDGLVFFAKKHDIGQIEVAAKRLRMTGDQRGTFGDSVEGEKAAGRGEGANDHGLSRSGNSSGWPETSLGLINERLAVNTMPPNAQPFERSFTPPDVIVFRELISDLIGQQCRRIGKLYGGAFSLHFGDLVPSSSAKGRDRGSWVVTAWGCDARLETRRGMIVDDCIVEREEV